MAVKAVALVYDIDEKNTSEFVARVKYTPMSTDTALVGTLEIDLDPEATALQLEQNIKIAVKAALQAQGFSFGLLDTVRLIGALV